MSSAKAANNLVLNPKLADNNLRAFIPSYRLIRTGIVKDIPQRGIRLVAILRLAL